MMETKSEYDLVRLAQQGDQRAFELLVRSHQRRVIGVVSRIVGEADAADIAQETFLKAYRALHSFRFESAFYTWIYRIAINTCKNHMVTRTRRPAGHDIDAADAEHNGHADKMADVATPESILLTEEINQKIA